MEQKFQTLDLKNIKGLSDDELANIEGSRAVLFAMFSEWQPASYMITRLYYEKVKRVEILRYLFTFRKFYLDKPHIYHFKTDWNFKFFNHCMRNKSWEKSE